MHIAIVPPDFPPVIGGAEIFSYEISRRLASKHEVHVITRRPGRSFLRREGVNLEGLPSHEEREGMHIHRTPFVDIKYFRHLTASPLMLKELLGVIDKENIDIIYGIQIYPAGQICALAKKLKNRAFLLNLQGLLVDVVKDDKTAFDLYFGALKPLGRFALRNADYIQPISNKIRDKVFELVGRLENIEIVPNGVDTSTFKPGIKSDVRSRYKIGEDEMLVITISRLAEKNGIEYLIKAAKIVLKKHPNVKFLIVGEGDLRDRLIRLVSELGIKDSVIFTGSVAHEEIPKYLAASDIFVRPSITEGFGIAFVEAMSCGLPVIGTKWIEELGVFTDGEEGLQVKPADAIDLSKKISLLIENGKRNIKMGEDGRKKAIKKFDWDVIVKGVEKRMEKIV